MTREVKQVIVMRTDLGMRKGKMIAQGAHASMKALMQRMGRYSGNASEDAQLGKHICWGMDMYEQEPMCLWLDGIFTKICVRVESEAQLLDICSNAEVVGIPTALIEDNGLTEFKGVKTKTCCAIGPWWADEIDKITGGLKLL